VFTFSCSSPTPATYLRKFGAWCECPYCWPTYGGQRPHPDMRGERR